MSAPLTLPDILLATAALLTLALNLALHGSEWLVRRGEDRARRAAWARRRVRCPAPRPVVVPQPETWFVTDTGTCSPSDGGRP